MNDLLIGCHLSTANGYAAMADDAVSIGATTFAFFTRNPRGGNARELRHAIRARDWPACGPRAVHLQPLLGEA